MRFSTRGEYGLRLAVSLAKTYPEIKNLKDISIEEKISLKYLERLAGNLRRANIIISSKGKNGGYMLFQKPQKMKVGEVIEATEGPIAVKCYGTGCKMIHRCPSSLVWIKLGEQIKKTLYGIKLSDLIK